MKKTPKMRAALKAAALLTPLMVVALPAQAGFVWEGVDVEPTRAVTDISPMQVAEGFGQDLPLPVAVAQIVPPGVPVDYAPGVQQSGTISWTGGKGWLDVLQDALRPLALNADYVGGRVTINSRPLAMLEHTAPQAQPQASSITPIPVTPPAGQAPQALAMAGDLPISVMDEAQPVHHDGVWLVRKGSTLRQVLEEWSAAAGWQKPLWTDGAVDFPIKASATFTGDWPQVAVDLMGHFVNAKPALRARVSKGNRIITIWFAENGNT